MALHFEILVNFQGIGRVQIRRMEDRVSGAGPLMYEVHVEFPMFTDPQVAYCLHDYHDGALVLIGKAMRAVVAQQEARKEARKVKAAKTRPRRPRPPGAG